MKIIEAIPNFSEGRDKKVIEKIVEAIAARPNVKVLNVDPGFDANRTVITFAGEVEEVCNSAFEAVKVASKEIDMSTHSGKHPRIGACDVLPLVPLSGITLEECAQWAHRLSGRIAQELNIPIYCYEASAFEPKRQNLASCRSGEYEGLKQKMESEEWRPDFGPTKYCESAKRSGASVVGARNFLVAVNFNLSTKDKDIATQIAMDVREKGRALRDEKGQIIRNEKGEALMQNGRMKRLKAIGWYIEEYGFAQVSTNITDIEIAPLHKVWEAVSQSAQEHGCSVTGTELIGLIPEKVINEAANYFCPQDNISIEKKIEIAIKRMNMNQISPFIADKRIIERLL